MRLNLGCGDDIREGWFNVDATVSKNVYAWDLASGLPPLPQGEVIEEIVALDLLEHLHHWEAMSLLRQCCHELESGGKLTVRVPDVVSIVKSEMSWDKKITRLFGGQDIPQGKSEAMEARRIKHPELFCHRWGWTTASLNAALLVAGFTMIRTEHEGVNIVATATK